jgi:ABC-type dipeptide/oligopeptide/nickel transport system permease subunit
LGNSFVLSFMSMIVICCVLVVVLGLSIFHQRRDFFLFKIVEVLDLLPGMIWLSLLMVMVGSLLSEGERFLFLSILLGLYHFPKVYRKIRGYVRVVTQRSFIEGAKALGLGNFHILYRHVMPEVWHLSYPIILQTWIQVILSESFVSFLGVGLRPTTLTMGSILHRGWSYFLTHPHLFVLPGLFLTLIFLMFRRKMRASLEGGPLKAQETVQ